MNPPQSVPPPPSGSVEPSASDRAFAARILSLEDDPNPNEQEEINWLANQIAAHVAAATARSESTLRARETELEAQLARYEQEKPASEHVAFSNAELVSQVLGLRTKLAKAEQQLAEAKEAPGTLLFSQRQLPIEIEKRKAAESALASAEADRKLLLEVRSAILAHEHISDTDYALGPFPWDETYNAEFARLLRALYATRSLAAMTAEPTAQPSPSSTSNGGRG